MYVQVCLILLVCLQLKVDEANKTCERVCQLEEELEGLRESEIQVQVCRVGSL